MRGLDWITLIKGYAEKWPQKVSFKEPGDTGLNYANLYGRVMGTAQSLELLFERKIPEQPVIVTVERSLNSVVAILSVIASGAWYVPVDCKIPKDRAKQLLEICNPAAILLGTEDNPFADSNVPTMQVLCADPCFEDAAAVRLPERDDAAPLFGIFTSGSTGVPKLVVKNNIGISDFIRTYCETFKFSENEHFANQVPFYFDASTKDLFATIYLGATCTILPKKVFSFPMSLITTLNAEKITSFVCVPSVMVSVSQAETFSQIKPETLEKVLFVGEKMPVRHLNYWRRNLPDTQFVNLYGSTEVAGNSCYFVVSRDFSDDEILPVGTPFENSRVVLMDEEGKVADEGEICVAGSGLAIGYFNDPEKTASVFRDEPELNAMFYHSGDYGRKNEHGEIVCVSRNDAQIKHMGQRVELGEVEACVSGFSFVQTCCCLFSASQNKMILFFSGVENSEKQVKKELQQKLPKYMIPDVFVFMRELPQNANGKTDRAGLLRNWEATVTKGE